MGACIMHVGVFNRVSITPYHTHYVVHYTQVPNGNLNVPAALGSVRNRLKGCLTGLCLVPMKKTL